MKNINTTPRSRLEDPGDGIAPRGKPVLIAVIGVLLLALVVGGFFLLRPEQPEDTPQRPDQEQTKEPAYVTIETAYCSFRIPAESSEKIHHKEIYEGAAVVERFYTQLLSGEKELFRIYFDAPECGDVIGKLTTGGKAVWVSVEVASYAKEEFTEYSMLPSDMVMCIPKAIKETIK